VRREITGYSNPLVKRVRSLRDKKHRKREGLFLAEGLRIMTEAREAGALPEMIFYAAEADPHPLGTALMEAVDAAGGEVIATSADILSKMSGKDNAQTLVGVYADRLTPLDRLDRAQADIWLVAQSLRDPGNLGTILRTGDAVGAGGLILVDDLRRSLLRRGGAGEHGGAVHATYRAVSLGRVYRLATRRAGGAHRHQPQYRSRLPAAALRRADLPADRQRGARPAGRL
jgi:tRNA G18 (ribose-2'-O)-methylase SpoU